MAEQLVIALATVNSHKSVILEHCRNRWAVDDIELLDYHWLRQLCALCATVGAWVGDQGSL
ncbi:MAG: hypothetical protein R2867_23590 [Caldilineaceae bacterium]